MKLSIVIPVYNEKNTIEHLVKKVQAVQLSQLEKEIIVVDDCSKDGTQHVLKEISSSYSCAVFYHEKNLGKGAALRTGFSKATGDYIIVQDADLEYDPEDFKKLLEPVFKYQADVVYGSRFIGDGAHRVLYFWHYIFNKILTLFSNMFTNLNLTDMETCYKLFKRNLLLQFKLEQNRFGFEPEITAKLAAIKNIRFFEVGISYNGRTYQEGKKISWKDGFPALYSIIKYGYKSNSIARKWLQVIFLFLLLTVNLIIFYWMYGFHPNNDTEGFVWMIERFRGIESPFFPNRYLNPFYPIVGATILRSLSPTHSLIVTNIIFYYGLALLTYALLKKVFKSSMVGILSALFVASAYPMLRYALTQVEDIGGYFWYVATIYCSWRWRETKKSYLLYLAGLMVSLGLLTKESGAMGALFFAGLLWITHDTLKNKLIFLGKFSILPFVTLCINQWRGQLIGYNSLQWFKDNWDIYFQNSYTFIKWLGINLTTFNLVWFFFFLGVYFCIKNFHTLNKDSKIYLKLMVFPSLSYFAWPLFISRTVFISAWLIIPLASYGLAILWNKKSALYTYFVGISVVFCLVAPYSLQSTLRYAHVFQILENCHYNISCSYNYFWDNRESFSKNK